MTTHAKVTAFVVDDEPLARRRLQDLIAGVPWLACIGEAASGRAAIGAIDELHPDLVFLDIQMPGLSGLDVLGRVSHRPAVIFTTAHDQYAITAFEVGALDYLLKPFGEERFTRAVERVRPMLEAQLGADAGERAREVLVEGPLARLFAREGGRVVPVALSAVEWFEAADDYVVVHAGTREFTIGLTMADLERRLDPQAFVRIHRSSMVNLDHVAAWEPFDGSRFRVTLRSGRTLMASRQRSRILRAIGR